MRFNYLIHRTCETEPSLFLRLCLRISVGEILSLEDNVAYCLCNIHLAKRLPSILDTDFHSALLCAPHHLTAPLTIAAIKRAIVCASSVDSLLV